MLKQGNDLGVFLQHTNSTTTPHRLALLFPPSFARLTNSQQISAAGPISCPPFIASSLLACLTAYRLAMPWKMMLSLNIANAVPHARSTLGSQPATSAYQVIAWSRVGRPGVCAPGANAG
jgi:hypothetical protein